jgi:hypothetical protein
MTLANGTMNARFRAQVQRFLREKTSGAHFLSYAVDSDEAIVQASTQVRIRELVFSCPQNIQRLENANRFPKRHTPRERAAFESGME